MASVCQSMRLLSFLKWLPDSPVQGGHFTFQPLLLDENLVRAELTPTEMADHLARREELWGRREVSTQVALKPKGGRPRGFAQETADATGVSHDTVSRAVSRAKAIPGDIRAIIKGTRLDTGTYLDSLKGMEPDDQRAQDSLNSTDCLCRLDSLPAVRDHADWCRPEPYSPRYPLGRHLSLPVDDLQAWLTDTLGRILDHKITRLDELMPWRYAQT